jgi:WD40 repeat protein
MTMVYVASGEFEMGAFGTGDTMRLPIHTVFLDGFWMDQTEVTNGQYAQCVAAGVCEPSLYAGFEQYSGENQPIVAVTWHDAAAYCEWVGGALPTEAQWEYAARGSANRSYPWGEDEPDCDRANYLDCVGTTAAVGSYPDGASWCGALDLAGNVYEWVADWSASYTGERQVNPVGPETGERKLIRGGSWLDFSPHLFSAQRIRYGPDEAGNTVGFRCVAPPAIADLPSGSETPVAEVISVDTAGRLERLRTLEGHSDRVLALAFSADGVTVASSSWDDTIRLWNVQSGQEIHTFNTDDMGMNGIAFSPDGRLLASANVIWDVASKQVIYTLGQGRRDPGRVAFSQDGALLAVHLVDQPITLWDVSSGQVVRTFDEQVDGNISFGIEFSPDGALLASGGGGSRMTLWDVESGQVTSILEYGDESDVHDLAFSPDGRFLASGGTDQAVRLWDVASREVVLSLAHWDGLYGVAFSPDGSLLASAGCERTVRLWAVASGRLVATLPHADEVMAVTFSPDGTLLVSGGYDNVIYVWGVSGLGNSAGDG